MTSDVFKFLVRGHEKVIDHYRVLLASRALSSALRSAIEEKLEREEAAHQRLIEEEGRYAA